MWFTPSWLGGVGVGFVSLFGRGGLVLASVEVVLVDLWSSVLQSSVDHFVLPRWRLYWLREEFGAPSGLKILLGEGGDVELGARTSKHILLFAFDPLTLNSLSLFTLCCALHHSYCHILYACIVPCIDSYCLILYAWLCLLVCLTCA